MSESTFECQICSRLFKTRRGLSVHTTKIHNKKIDKKEEIINDINVIKSDVIKTDVKNDVFKSDINLISPKITEEEFDYDLILNKLEDKKTNYKNDDVEKLREYISENHLIIAKGFNDLYIYSGYIVEKTWANYVEKKYKIYIKDFYKRLENKREHSLQLWERYVGKSKSEPGKLMKYFTKYIDNPEYQLLGEYLLCLVYSTEYAIKSGTKLNAKKFNDDLKNKEYLKVDKVDKFDKKIDVDIEKDYLLLESELETEFEENPMSKTFENSIKK